MMSISVSLLDTSFECFVRKTYHHPISDETILHRHQFAHDVVIRQLRRRTQPNKRPATDQSAYTLCSRAHDTPDEPECCAANEDVSSSEDIRHSPNNGQTDSNHLCLISLLHFTPFPIPLPAFNEE
jgi:hypothetical protein